MTSPTTDRCPLDLRDETLSAWRDGLLGQRDIQRIAEHMPTCAACQQRIGDFERIRHALVGQRVPDVQAQVWREVRASIDADLHRGHRSRTRPTAGAGLVTLAAALLVALFAMLLYGRIGHISPLGKGTPTASLIATNTLASTATTTATTTSLGNWQRVDTVGDQGFPGIAFAPSQPAHGYACSVDPANNYRFAVSVSSDAGRTWHAATLPGISGTLCLVSVNPTDPQDVVVVNNQTQNGIMIARSRNGGTTWTKPDVGNLAFDALGWAGSSLFVGTQVTENPVSSQVNLYVSVDGQPFVRVDKNGFVSGIELGGPRLIVGVGSTVFLQSGQVEQPQTGGTIVSHDNGQTWAPITFHDGSQLVYLISATPTMADDALVMVGVYASLNNQVVVSRDEGATWQKLPTAPAGVPYYQFLGVTPDETVFAVSNTVFQQDNPDRNIYSARAGDAQWHVATTLPAGARLTTITWDANGHATDFWAGDVSPGVLSWIVYHL